MPFEVLKLLGGSHRLAVPDGVLLVQCLVARRLE